MKIKLLNSNRANIVFIGLVIINICVSYLVGSTGIYAATAFREYGRLDLFNVMFIIEPLARSISLLASGRAGEYFGRKQLYMWSVGAFALSVLISAGASNGVVFLISRGASGFFWGLFFANVFTMVNDIMSEEEYPVRIGVGIHQVVPFAFAQRHLDDKLIAEGISFISFVQGIAGVIAGMIYSETMRNGIAFSLAFTVVYSVTLILITILKYKEPQGEKCSEENMLMG